MPADVIVQAALLVFVNAACGAWAAAKLWQRRKARAAPSREPQAGQRWRLASGAAVAAALVGHLSSVGLRAELADTERSGSSLCDVLSALLCLLLLVSALLWPWAPLEHSCGGSLF